MNKGTEENINRKLIIKINIITRKIELNQEKTLFIRNKIYIRL